MTSAKVAVTISSEVLAEAKKQVRSGRAKSLSAFVAQAVAEKIRRDDLNDILDAMDEAHGKPSKADQAWAKRVLRRSS